MCCDVFIHPYGVLALVSLALNVPCGYFRARALKFSPAWFFWIHASIPLIIYCRVCAGTSRAFIPVCIALAVAGQMLGSRWCRRRMSAGEREELLQVPVSGLDHGTPRRIPDHEAAVVLLNMGGPRSLDEVQGFLFNVFRDPRLLRLPGGPLVQTLFAFVLSRARSAAARKRYALIGGKSPIHDSTEGQRAALEKELLRRGRGLKVYTVFNYSPPGTVELFDQLAPTPVRHVLPLSLYPHDSRATTGSSVQVLTRAARRHDPALEVLPVPSYCDHPGYISAVAARVRETLKPGESLDSFFLLFSAHSLPLYFVIEGDPYPGHIARTTALVLRELGRASGWALSWQSAVGPLRWIRPYTEDMIPALARRGSRKLIVVPVSFVTDHIETLCEIDMEYRHLAGQEGITDFRMSRAVEAHPDFILALADAVERGLPRFSPGP